MKYGASTMQRCYYAEDGEKPSIFYRTWHAQDGQAVVFVLTWLRAAE